MFCKTCGSEITGNNKFCPKCGAAQGVTTALFDHPNGNHTPSVHNQPKPNINPAPVKAPKQPRVKKEMTKKQRAGIIVGLILAIVVIIGIIFGVLYFSGSAYKVYRSMKSENYADAVSTYQIEVKDSLLQNMFANSLLEDYAAKVYDEFTQGKIEFESACTALESLEQMGFKNAKDYYDKVTAQNEGNLAYEQGITYYENGDYENAIKELSKIADGNSNYSNAQEKLKALYPQYVASVTEKAKEFVAARDYEKALSILSVALQILPKEGVDTSELTTIKDSCSSSYRQSIISKVTKLINEENYAEAINVATEALTIDDNEELRNAKNTAEAKYIESVKAKVNELIAKEDYTAAERIVNTALTVLPNNSDLLNLQTTVKDSTPVYLLDVCKPYVKGADYTEYVNGETFVVGGVEMTNGFSMSNDSTLFNFDAKYTSLSFSIGAPNSSGDDFTLKIYLDGVLKSTYEVSHEDLAKKVTLDVTGVKQVKFSVEDWYKNVGIGNITVK